MGMRTLGQAGSAAWALAIAGTASAATEIPSRFVDDGVYVRLKTVGGGLLELYTDTGGGGLILSRAAAARLGLKVKPATDPEARTELGPDAGLAKAPAIDPALPPLPADAVVVARAAQNPVLPEQADGFLGARWFGRGVWTWDYPRRKLILQDADWAAPRGAHSAPLGFKVDPDGSRPTNFARVAVAIDGQQLEMLLDTGAETALKPAAQKAVGLGEGFHATSMVESRIFQQWRKAHPDWRYLPDAQAATGAAMIEVPHATLAGIEVGPVWFTERPDANFDRFMSSMMDKPVVGSIGGNAFHNLRMTIDFKGARAWFERSR